MEKQKALRVVRNFETSPYTTQIGQFEFVFSSDFNRRRFKHYFPFEKQKFAARVRKLYGVAVYYNELTAFVLYSRIERRGFLIRRRACGVVESYSNPGVFAVVARIHEIPGEEIAE